MRRALAFLSRSLWLVPMLSLLLSACGGGGGGGNAPVTLSRVEVTPSVVSRAAGTQQQYVAMAIFSDNSRQDVSATVAWSSSDTTVATISVTGLASALRTGSTNIVATYQTLTGSTSLTVTPAVIRSLAVTPSTASIANGTTQAFVATATFSDNSTQVVTTGATWSSSATGVATISNASGSNGVARGVSVGSATITAAYQGQTATASLTITAATLVSVAVTPATPSIANGTTQAFAATATFTDNTTQDVTTAATWSSSATNVATISNTAGSNGVATGVSVGNTTISAAYQGQSGSTTLTVTPAVLVSLAVTPPNPSVARGLTQQFAATGTYSDRTTQDLTAAATWASATPATATISNAAGSNGLAQSIATGTTVISATLSGVTGSTVLTVTAATLTRIDINPVAPSVPRGLTQQFTATGVYTDNSTQNLTTTVTWASSNTSIADISNAAGSQGLAAASNTGTATITAVTGGVTGTTTITVTAAALSQIQVTPANPALARGFTRQFTATGVYSDNSTRDITNAVTWASTNTNVATISNAAGSAGLATGVAPGTTTITATQGSLNGTTRLTVTAATLSAVTISPSAVSIANGLSQQYTATGTFSDSTTQDLTTQVSWSSSAMTVATISNAAGSQGLATSAAPGTTTISAASGTVTGTTSLTVTAATLVSIAVSTTTPSVPNGNTAQFAATGTFTDNSSSDITTQVTWSSSDTATATISNATGSQGLARGARVGSATISAVLQGKTGTATLTVTAAVLRSIAITPPSASIALGSSLQYTATGTYSDNTTADITTSVMWASDTAATATISNASGSAGLASSVASGTTTISATLSGITGSTLLTVTPVALTSIAVTPANASTPSGTTLAYSATGTYSDSSTQDLTTQVAWSSSNTAIADISNAANMQGMAVTRTPGAVVITATFASAGSAPVSGTTNLTVTAATVTAITFSTPSSTTPSPSVAVGYRQQYIALARYSDSTVVDVTSSATWSTLNPAFATIGNSAADKGLLTPVAEGSTTVVAQFGGVSGSVPVSTTLATLRTIAVTPANPQIVRGTSQQFAATGMFSDNTTLALTTQVTWVSSNTNVATISNAAPTQGLATAGRLSVGTTTISAALSGVSGSTPLRVTLN